MEEFSQSWIPLPPLTPAGKWRFRTQSRRIHQQLKKSLHLFKSTSSCAIHFYTAHAEGCVRTNKARSKTGSAEKSDTGVKGGLKLPVRIMLNLNAYCTSLLSIGLSHIRATYSPLKPSFSLFSSALFILCCRGGMEKFWKVLPLSVKKLSHHHPLSLLLHCACAWETQHFSALSSLAELDGRSTVLSCRMSRWVDPLKTSVLFLLRLVTNFCRIGCQKECPVFWQC